MATPLITLLTDFGLSDHYVGAMKGVIYSICPEARIVDITHGVPVYAIGQAAYLLSQSWPYFPKGTIHVVVVDPGVGSARRPILVEAGEHFFVGPDNGLFTGVVRHITAHQYFHHPVSRTFHGRDIFAPVAAHLANGVPVSNFGAAIEDYQRAMPSGPNTGTILHIDHFGNIITSFRAADFASFHLKLGHRTIDTFAQNYADAPTGPFLIEGSSGYWEISARQASAAELLNAKAGDPVQLSLLVPQNTGVSHL